MTEVNITFFNVHHGDSSVIEIIIGGKSYYIVVDSNKIRQGSTYINPAAEYLKTIGVDTISALIITHFHKDHINGIEQFFQNFNIIKLCVPPVISKKSNVTDEIIKRYKDKIEETLLSTHDVEIKGSMRSFIHLIKYIAKSDEDKMEEYLGRETPLKIPGQGAHVGTIYLPLARIKGILYQRILDQNFEIEPFEDMNDMSVAFSINAFGFNVLFGGDSTKSQWELHQRMMRQYAIDNLKIHVLKSPHHGSENNNNEDLYNYWLDIDAPEKHLIISANGISHPSDIIFPLREKFDLQTHCTNISHHCANNRYNYFSGKGNIPLEAMPFIALYKSKDRYLPCHDDIYCKITPGNLQIKGKTNKNCIY